MPQNRDSKPRPLSEEELAEFDRLMASGYERFEKEMNSGPLREWTLLPGEDSEPPDQSPSPETQPASSSQAPQVVHLDSTPKAGHVFLPNPRRVKL